MMKKSKMHSKIFRAFSVVSLLIICCSGLFGCAMAGSTAATAAIGEASLSKSRAKINITEDESSIKDCKFIKDVQAKSYWGGLLYQDKALEKTIADMTHEATEAGADTLLIKSKTKTFGGSNSEGAAYLCPIADKTTTSTNEPLAEKSR